MNILLIVIHVIACFVLVGAILLQSGKGGGMGAGFGGAAAAGQQIFGGRGAAGFLGKLTVAVAAVFMLTSLSLAWLSSRPSSVLDLSQTSGAGIQQQAEEIVEQGGQGGIAAPIELPAADEAPAADVAPAADEAPAATDEAGEATE